MPQIEYADLHCDSITACCDADGDIASYNGQINTQKLVSAGCALQCFAIFTEGKSAAADFERYAAFYNAQLAVNPHILPVKCYADYLAARKSGRVAALLTVENMGFLNGDVGGIEGLKKAGVGMASLVWNTPNQFAYPNLVMRGGRPMFLKSEPRGLTELGREAVKELNRNKIIIDVSHLSDGGADEVLALSSSPVVASHSNCRAVHPVCRNLTDAQIKRIADKGGVVGLNFCRDFVGGESASEGLLAHLKHLIDVGGEDVVAIGSDFDGIPRYEELDDCLKVQPLLEYFIDNGVPRRVAEKTLTNFLRVFKEVIG